MKVVAITGHYQNTRQQKRLQHSSTEILLNTPKAIKIGLRTRDNRFETHRHQIVSDSVDPKPP